MAGASINDIKARIKSVESTMQITKAMELVATSKLRRAKENVERSRPYYEILRKAIDTVSRSADAKDTLLTEKRGEFKQSVNNEGAKRVYYMSIEFLLGRSLKTNL